MGESIAEWVDARGQGGRGVSAPSDTRFTRARSDNVVTEESRVQPDPSMGRRRRRALMFLWITLFVINVGLALAFAEFRSISTAGSTSLAVGGILAVVQMGRPVGLRATRLFSAVSGMLLIGGLLAAIVSASRLLP